MALTKVKLIADGVINVDNLAASHGITTDNIGEGLSLYYTNERVGTYLTANNYATQSFVTTAVSNLVDAAPSTLDTLNELAAALGDDPNFATTVTNSIAGKLPLTGGNLTGSFSVDTSIFVVDKDTARVGIGTTSPGAKLDVNGLVNISNGFGEPSTESSYRLRFYDNGGVHNDPGIGLDGSGGGGEQMWFNALQGFYWGFGTSGTKMKLASTGLGIGTTSPTEVLDVNGALKLRTNANNFQNGNQTVVDFYDAGSVGRISAYKASGGAGLAFYTNPDGGNATERVRINSLGKVGIGTTSPLASLHVDGDAYLTQGAWINDGYALLWTNSYGTSYAYIDGAGSNGTNSRLSFATNATERIRIINNGNVGIGTTSPKEKFEVSGLNGNIRLYGRNGIADNQISSNVYYDGSWLRDNSSYGATAIRMNQSGYLALHTTSATSGFPDERIRIDASGNIGINQTTPSLKLHVSEIGANISGGNAISTSTMKGIRLDNMYNGDESIGLWFNTGGSHWSGISGQRSNAAGGWGTDLRFYTHETATNDLTYARERVRISSEGYVGIGTASPSYELDVAGRTNSYYYRVAGIHGLSGYVLPQGYWLGGSSTATNLSIAAEGGNGLAFFTNGTVDFRMFINTSGNVGIGTTNPRQKFDISGNNGQPATSGTTQNGLFRAQVSSGVGYGETLDMGMHVGVTGPASYAWIQSTNADNLNINYNLSLNPNGGNVGIGTASPATKLEVVQSAGWNGSNYAIKANHYSTFNGIRINGQDQERDIFQENNGYGIGIATSGAQPIKFLISSSNEIMRINGNGRIGMGTTSPAAKIDVAGGIKQSNPSQTYSRVQTVHGQNGAYSTVKVIFNKTDWGSVTYDIKVASAGGTYHTAGAYYSNPGFSNDLVSISTGSGISVSKTAENLTGGSQGATWTFSGATMVHPIVTVDIACGNGFQVTEDSIIVQIT